MNGLSFQVKVRGELQTARLQFATKKELQRYHRSLSSAVKTSSQVSRDAVEFTRLAAKRWRYYAEAGEAAEDFPNSGGQWQRINTVKWLSF